MKSLVMKFSDNVLSRDEMKQVRGGNDQDEDADTNPEGGGKSKCKCIVNDTRNSCTASGTGAVLSCSSTWQTYSLTVYDCKC